MLKKIKNNNTQQYIKNLYTNTNWDISQEIKATLISKNQSM